MAGEGATFRDKFASVAPWPIPDWFEPTGLPVRPTPMMTPEEYFNDKEGNPATYLPVYQFYTRDTNTWDEETAALNGATITEEDKYVVSEYWGAYDYNVAEIEVWDTDYEKEKFFQWRWYYADEMLIARTGGDIS